MGLVAPLAEFVQLAGERLHVSCSTTPGAAGAQEIRACVAPAAAIDREVGKPPFDIRDRQPEAAPLPRDAASVKGRERLSDRLGREGVLDLDPQTNTPRVVAKLDGFLKP